MLPVDRVRSLSATRKFLMFLAAFGLCDDVLPRKLILKAAYHSWPDEYLAELSEEFRDRDTAKLFKKLRERGLIESSRVGNRVWHVLTEKGLHLVTREQMMLAPKLDDGKLLIVSFDVPERERKARDALRFFLRRCGFTRWHDSLWVTERDVRHLLVSVFERMGTGQWIVLYEARSVFRPQ